MNSKDDVRYWDALRGKIRCSKGGWKLGESVYSHGYDLLNELVGEYSFFQILILNTTGKRIERNQADWIEACFGCLSWPDPRIWCNQIAALSGSTKAPAIPAILSGTLAADSRMYGGGVMQECTAFILQAQVDYQQGKSCAEIIDNELTRKKQQGLKKPVIPGYSRPITKGDERVTVMHRVSQQLGIKQGRHCSLAAMLDDVISKQYDDRINLGGYYGAMLADFGFTPEEAERINTLIATAGVHACYAEYADKEPLSILPLRCADVRYTGPAKRSLPTRYLPKHS